MYFIIYVFCIFECLRAPRKMDKFSLGSPPLNKDFIIIIMIIMYDPPPVVSKTTSLRFFDDEN